VVTRVVPARYPAAEHERRPRDVDAEVPPHAGGIQDVQVGVAQVAVEEMEQRGAAATDGVAAPSLTW
jgi:hypothetical protein